MNKRGSLHLLSEVDVKLASSEESQLENESAGESPEMLINKTNQGQSIEALSVTCSLQLLAQLGDLGILFWCCVARVTALSSWGSGREIVVIILWVEDHGWVFGGHDSWFFSLNFPWVKMSVRMGEVGKVLKGSQMRREVLYVRTMGFVVLRVVA